VSNAPPITTTTNPTAPATHKVEKCTHFRQTCNNTPGTVPPIISQEIEETTTRRSPRLQHIAPVETPIIASDTIKRPPNRIPVYSPNIISQEAVNLVTSNVYYKNDDTWTPTSFLTSAPSKLGSSNFDVDIEHFCAPVIHPTTGETITQYKKLIKDPVTKEIWETAFGKEFGRMAQGDNKTKCEGTNSIFVMSHDEIKQIPKD